MSDLREGKTSRIILTRPAVEAGEALGFLPGDLYEKITPYLRPLHDALQDMQPSEELQKLMERGHLFRRGREERIGEDQHLVFWVALKFRWRAIPALNVIS